MNQKMAFKIGDIFTSDKGDELEISEIREDYISVKLHGAYPLAKMQLTKEESENVAEYFQVKSPGIEPVNPIVRAFPIN